MASQSYRSIIAALSLCESCALSIHNSNGKVPQASRLLSEVLEQLKNAAREAREHWPAALTKKDADKIAEGMKKADSANPFLDDRQRECTIYYTSLALGLVDELFRHIKGALKREHLERVERAICICTNISTAIWTALLFMSTHPERSRFGLNA